MADKTLKDACAEISPIFGFLVRPVLVWLFGGIRHSEAVHTSDAEIRTRLSEY